MSLWVLLLTRHHTNSQIHIIRSCIYCRVQASPNFTWLWEQLLCISNLLIAQSHLGPAPDTGRWVWTHMQKAVCTCSACNTHWWQYSLCDNHRPWPTETEPASFVSHWTKLQPPSLPSKQKLRIILWITNIVKRSLYDFTTIHHNSLIADFLWHILQHRGSTFTSPIKKKKTIKTPSC